MKTYPYSLSRKATRCPSCGRMTFKAYVDSRGIPMGDGTAGRCNREIKCAYHLTPRQWRQANPSALPPTPFRHTAPPPKPPMSTVERRQMECSVRCEAATQLPLTRWLGSMFGPQAVSQAMKLYNVGYARFGGGSTVWWYVDPQGRVRSGKAMVYLPDGHRFKGHPSLPAVGWAHTEIARRTGEDFRFEFCFFGSHLLASPAYSDATLMIVESEKTALMLHLWLEAHGAGNRYLPIATGGCSNIRIDPERIYDHDYRWAPLRGRRIILIPDADKAAEWDSTEFHRRLGAVALTLRIIDIRPYAPSPSADIADIIAARS